MIKNAMQPAVCAPKVEGFMLKPAYWIEKIGDAEKLILNEEEIIKFNRRSFRKMKYKGFEEWLYDLKKRRLWLWIKVFSKIFITNVAN